MPEFDPLAILDKVNRISDAEIARSKAEWRALYGELYRSQSLRSLNTARRCRMKAAASRRC